MARKPRIDKDGPSPLQRLKHLPQEEQEQVVAHASQVSGRKLIAQIERRHGICGLTEPRLSDFLRYVQEQREIRAANATVDNIREIFAEVMPEAGAEETHKFLVKFLMARGFATNNERALQFAAVETRKGIEIEHEREKFEFNAAQAALKCLPQLKAIAADKTMDEPQRLDAARKHLFGVTPK